MTKHDGMTETAERGEKQREETGQCRTGQRWTKSQGGHDKTYQWTMTNEFAGLDTARLDNDRQLDNTCMFAKVARGIKLHRKLINLSHVVACRKM